MPISKINTVIIDLNLPRGYGISLIITNINANIDIITIFSPQLIQKTDTYGTPSSHSLNCSYLDRCPYFCISCPIFPELIYPD